jgi:hypothetical protein
MVTMLMTQPSGVSGEAAWPLATAIAHPPIEVGEISFTIGTRPPMICGTNMTAKATPAIPAVLLTAVPAPRVRAT